MGNTSDIPSNVFAMAVHPHACGEYLGGRAWDLLGGGSSPRVWGIRMMLRTVWSRRRFIPTRVGNTICLSALIAFHSVHPHACGEYSGALPITTSRVGSSPRVWGIRDMFFRFRTGSRFIPTRVGNTKPGNTKSIQHSVHPHACGEYADAIFESLWCLGSSPRVWGIL